MYLFPALFACKAWNGAGQLNGIETVTPNNILPLFWLLLSLASQRTSWSSWDVTGKWIHPVWSSIVPSKLTRPLMTQIQDLLVPFSVCVCFMSKEPHSEVLKQMSRHSSFVNTVRPKSIMLLSASNRPGCWRLSRISWKFLVALWHVLQDWGNANIRKKTEKNVDKRDVDILMTFLFAVVE